MRYVGLLLICGCALTTKQAPLEFRYFAPPAGPTPRNVTERAADAKLRLGAITSSTNLRTRIVYRASPIEVGEHFTLRWTENPEVYLRRSLSRALFEEGHFAPGEDPLLPALEVELIAFEEVRVRGNHAGRVELHYQLSDDRDVLAAGSINVERKAEPGIEGAVVAIGAAMDQAVDELSQVVATHVH